MPFYHGIGFCVLFKRIRNWTAPIKNPVETSGLFLCVQVLFCYEQFDELTLLHLREFDKKKLISVETDIVVDHYKEEKFEDSKPGPPLSHMQSS